MAAKRKAAANIFMEQNVQNVAQFADELEELAEEPPMEAERLSRDLDLPVQPPSLAPRSVAVPAAPRQRRPLFAKEPPPGEGLKTSEELQLEKEPIRVRETGIWFWRRIIVPPNAYVVHTRAGHSEPVTIGLGLSFRYNAHTDAYMVVPAAMQTIGVVANCISKEKQGINILAYVQWQIDDFSVAYRKLDFSDSRDPLGIVNAQLREQAEAGIKDKIATMSVEEVLTDKEPIIEELTTRLKTVAEARSQGDQSIDEGLGIKIVTVQIKEAVVSSRRLWEDLQAPFRYEKQKAARISHLLMQDELKQKELETRQLSETRQAETEVAIERIKQGKQTEALQTRLTEEGIRFSKEQESALERTQLEIENSLSKKKLQVEQAITEGQEESRLAEGKAQAAQEEIQRTILLKTQEAELNRLVQEQRDALQQQSLQAQLLRQKEETSTQLELEEAANRVKMALAEKEMEIAKLQQEIRNLTNEQDLASRLIAQLPDIAAQMPAIDELKVLQTGQDGAAFDALATFMSHMLALGESLGIPLVRNEAKSSTANGEMSE